MSRAQWLAFGSTLVTGCVTPSDPPAPARPVVDAAADVTANDAVATDARVVDSRDVGAPWDAPAGDAPAGDAPAVVDAGSCAGHPGTFPCSSVLCCDRATEYCSTSEFSGASCVPIDSPAAPQCVAEHVCDCVDGGPGYYGPGCSCIQDDDAGAITIACRACYGSPPARLRRALLPAA
jgi:hypothetical protein